MRPTRLTILTACLILVCGGITVWSYGRMARARQLAAAATADTQRCQQLKQQINELRDRPKLAKTRALEQPEITSRIEDAARQASIAPGSAASLVRIDPGQRGQRLGESVYRARPVHIQLQNVTLKQLVAMLKPLVAEGAGLRSKRIHVTAPPGNDRQRRWNADVTLTYLIYSPASSARRG